MGNWIPVGFFIFPWDFLFSHGRFISRGNLKIHRIIPWENNLAYFLWTVQNCLKKIFLKKEHDSQSNDLLIEHSILNYWTYSPTTWKPPRKVMCNTKSVFWFIKRGDVCLPNTRMMFQYTGNWTVSFSWTRSQ